MKGRKTGGRVRGVPNKFPEHRKSGIREVLDLLAIDKDGQDLHLARLHQLTQHDDPHVSIKALVTALPFRFGKPPDQVEFPDGTTKPVRRVLFSLPDEPAVE